MALFAKLQVPPLQRAPKGEEIEVTSECDPCDGYPRTRGTPLNAADPATFYGGGHTGYTDYPTLGAAQKRHGTVARR